MKQAYSFDDILMVPQYSDIKADVKLTLQAS